MGARIFYVLGWMVGLGVLGACAGPSSGGGAGLASPVAGERHTVLLINPDLARKVSIEDQSLSREEGEVILAETLIRNQSVEPLEITVRCLFKDQLGVTQETSPWKTISIQPGQRTVYVAPSLNRYATRFIVEIRNSRE